MGDRLPPRADAARLTLWVIFVASAVNAIFHSLLRALDISARSYIFQDDLWGDFYKHLFSYRAAGDQPLIAPNLGFVDMLRHYIAQTSAAQQLTLIGRTTGVEPTHFHMMPFSTLLSVLLEKGMTIIPAQALFYVNLLILLALTDLIAKLISDDQRQRSLMTLAMLIAYPFLFALQRGNLFAVWTSYSIIAFTLLALRGRSIWFALAILALGASIRPTAVMFAMLLLVRPGATIRSCIAQGLALAGMMIAVHFASLAALGVLYPDYTMAALSKGLRIYHLLYIELFMGLPYNSSLFALLRIIHTYKPLYELIGLVLPCIAALFALWQAWRGRLTGAELCLIICCTYILSSSVSGDYHLLVFFAPIVVLLLNWQVAQPDGRMTLREAVVFSVSLFMLCPKNYLFYNGVSLFVFANPVVALSATLWLLWESLSGDQSPASAR